jgi:hypothetical protein
MPNIFIKNRGWASPRAEFICTFTVMRGSQGRVGVQLKPVNVTSLLWMLGLCPPTRFLLPVVMARFVAAVCALEHPEPEDVQLDLTNSIAPDRAAASAARCASLRAR